ncbi:MAG: TetR/AcrR family transcriptional regulator, partial [Desulfovibrionaceae bacterium]
MPDKPPAPAPRRAPDRPGHPDRFGRPAGRTAADAADRHPDTKERLLRAAVDIFATKGYLAATVRDICAAAGANSAAVNYHFGDKNRLYAAVLHHIFTEHQDLDGCIPPLPPGAPAAARLERHLRIAVRKIYHDADRPCPGSPAPIFLMEMARPSEHLGELTDRYIRPDHEALQGILSELLGPEAPKALVN